SHAHVSVHVVRHAKRDRYSDDCVCNCDCEKSAVPAEHFCKRQSTQSCCDYQYRIWQMRGGKQHRRRKDRALAAAEERFESQEEVRLCDELLSQSPERVSSEVN